MPSSPSATRDRGPDLAYRSLTAPVRAGLRLAAVLQGGAAVLALVPFAAVYELLDGYPDAPDSRRAWTVPAVAAAAALGQFVLGGAAVGVSHRADADLALSLRGRITQVLRRVPLGWFTRGTSGQVQAALQDDLGELHYAVAHARLDLTAALVAPAAALAWLFVLCWPLALLIVVLICTFVGIRAAVLRRAGSGIADIVRTMRALHSATAEFVQGIAAVKLYGRAGRAHRRFSEAADDYHQTFVRTNGPVLRLISLGTAVLAPVTVLAAVLIAGTALVAADQIRPVAVLPALLLGLGLVGPVRGYGQAGAALKSAKAAAGRINALLEAPVLAEPAEPRGPADSAVRLRAVSFSHIPGTPTLREVTADLAPGTLTALAGPSGAGKSTLAGLVARFFDADAGAVSIGGVDVRDIDSATLHRTVGIVPQDAVLLRTTVTDNIRLGRPDASPAEIEQAARAARIHEVISTLPRGYDSVVGMDAQFSGGQAQRLAVARLLLADPAVVILDEATAYADPDSEVAVQEAFSRLAAGRTVLVVTHRLRTVTRADQILVLDGGSLVERGRHEELLSLDGVYRRLWDAQEAAEPGDLVVDGAPIAAGEDSR